MKKLLAILLSLVALALLSVPLSYTGARVVIGEMARKDCQKFSAWPVVMWDFKVYCATTYGGSYYIAPLEELREFAPLEGERDG